jgi:hypothetical protein
MWDRPAAFSSERRDVIGAWLACLAFGVGCFALLSAAAPERGGSPAALINPDPIATVASAQAHRPRGC